MYVVCLIFASLGIFGSVLVMVIFILKPGAIDKKAINDASKMLGVQQEKFGRSHPPILT